MVHWQVWSTVEHGLLKILRSEAAIQSPNVVDSDLCSSSLQLVFLVARMICLHFGMKARCISWTALQPPMWLWAPMLIDSTMDKLFRTHHRLLESNKNECVRQQL